MSIQKEGWINILKMFGKTMDFTLGLLREDFWSSYYFVPPQEGVFYQA